MRRIRRKSGSDRDIFTHCPENVCVMNAGIPISQRLSSRNILCLAALLGLFASSVGLSISPVGLPAPGCSCDVKPGSDCCCSKTKPARAQKSCCSGTVESQTQSASAMTTARSQPSLCCSRSSATRCKASAEAVASVSACRCGKVSESVILMAQDGPRILCRNAMLPANMCGFPVVLHPTVCPIAVARQPETPPPECT